MLQELLTLEYYITIGSILLVAIIYSWIFGRKSKKIKMLKDGKFWGLIFLILLTYTIVRIIFIQVG